MLTAKEAKLKTDTASPFVDLLMSEIAELIEEAASDGNYGIIKLFDKLSNNELLKNKEIHSHHVECVLKKLESLGYTLIGAYSHPVLGFNIYYDISISWHSSPEVKEVENVND